MDTFTPSIYVLQND